MRIALAQTNPHLGNFQKNFDDIIDYVVRASEKHVDLVVFPELSFFGYWPADSLEKKYLVDEQLRFLNRLHAKVPKGLGVLVGVLRHNPEKYGKPYRNGAAFLARGEKIRFFDKEVLPTYDVFDEARFVAPGSMKSNFLKWKSKTILVTVCEDIWVWEKPWFGTRNFENPFLSIKRKKVDVCVNLSASPFSKGHLRARKNVVTKTAKFLGSPVVYVNCVGGQDEKIFDGGSIVIDKNGKVLAQSAYFEEDLNVFDLKTAQGGFRKQNLSETESIRQALVLGIRDFVRKCGGQRVHLGLSGGIDSAVALCLATDALGPQKVTAIGMPGPHSGPESLLLAKKLAQNIGCDWREFPILETYETLSNGLRKNFGIKEFGLTHENIQARIRGLVLMAFANQEKSFLLTTGNKSEYATGYATLYGDMCGSLAPLGDLLKGEVYALAKHYNQGHELIPQEIITRPPTAELRPNQKDQDSLPPYDLLDQAVDALVTHGKKPRTPTEKWLAPILLKTEFKRWQAPPILRVSTHAFGRGRRYPIVNSAT